MKILKNIKKNTILLVLITIIVLYFVLKDDFNGIVQSLENMKLLYILLALVFYIISVLLKGTMNYIIINDSEKIPLREAIGQNVIAQFFNGITPFSTGGEPMAVYMLRERGIPVSKATNYMVQSFIFYQTALVICGLVAVVYNAVFQIFPKVQFLQHLVVLGFLINFAIVLLLLVTFSKKVTDVLCNIAKKLCKKFKINREPEDIEKKFEEYHAGFAEMKKRKYLFFLGVAVNMASLIFLYITPYFILRGMGDDTSLSVMNTLVSSAYVYLIGGFVPIPGASGGIEYGFMRFFGNFVGGSTINAMLLVWRTLTYYFGMILGAIIFNVRERVKK